jgi:hypothetical protein
MTSIPPPGHHPSLEGGWRLEPANPNGEPPLDPLSRRLLQIAAVLSVVLILMVMYAWLHGGGGNPLNPIAEAAERTQQFPGARSDIEAVYTSPALSHPVVATGHGLYNAQTSRSQAVLTVPTPTLGPVKVESVGDDRTVYLRSNQISERLPPGRKWMGIQPWLGQSAETALAGNGGARGELEMLKGVGDDVESLGQEEVRGVSTTHYRSTIDLGHYADVLRREGKGTSAREYEQLAKLMPTPITVEVSIDARGVVRRLRTISTLPSTAGRPAVTMDMRMDLFDFGITPDVPLPSADEVFDATPLFRAQLHLLGTESSVPSAESTSGGEPLAPAAFHKRTDGICRDLKRQMSRLRDQAAPQIHALNQLSRERRAGTASTESTLDAFQKASLAYFEPGIRIAQGGLRRLSRLAPPPAVRVDYRHLLRLSTLATEIDLAETRAVEIGELRTARALSHRLHAVSHRAKRISKRAGLDSCGGRGGQGIA